MIPAVNATIGSKGPASLPALPSSLKVLFVALDAVRSLATNGVGQSIAKSGSVCTLTYAAGAFTTALVNTYITLAGWPTAANNGTFVVSAVPAANQLQWVNASGAAEASGSATWKAYGSFTSITDRIAGCVAVPGSSSIFVNADGFTEATGKIIGACVGGSVAHYNQAPDVGGVLAALGGSSMSMYMYGKRESATTSITAFSMLQAASPSSFIRANFVNSNDMVSSRSNGGASETATLATNPLISTTSMSSWCWAYDFATQGQAFKNAASMGAAAPMTMGVAPVVDAVRLGPTTSGQQYRWRAIGLFNAYASAADQAATDAYVQAVYA